MKECYKPKTSYEIQIAPEEYILKTHIDNASVQDHFIAGAEWMRERMQETNEGQALLYAVEKTAERTKREMIEKATQFIYDTIFDWTGGSVTKTWTQCRDEYVERLKQAMQDESK